MALTAFAVAATLAPAALAAALRTVPVRVSPPAGPPATTFTISFRTPDRTGVHGSLAVRDELTGAVAHGGAGCVSRFRAVAPAGAAGARISVRLGPARIGGRWCAGRWSGRIEELAAPVCAPGRACPQFIVMRGVIGRFAFTVTPAGGAAPTFAGVVSAYACTPGPQRPGQTTPFTLTWKPAADPDTPSSQIVYEVFLATRPGGEDYATPSWTTAPGATSFRTPGLASHGTFYFVVRARDAAGNVDANTVEVRGVDPCY